MPIKFFGIKGALQIFAGLLFLIFTVNTAAAQNFTFDGGGGILLYWKGEQISYWQGGFVWKNNRNFTNEFNFLTVNSDISKFSGELLKLDYSAQFDFSRIHPKFTAGYVELSATDISFGTKKITIGGAEGGYAGVSVGFDVDKFTITPLVMFGKVEFGDGDFNFFYGKLDIPRVMRSEISVEYDKKHKIGVSYTDLDLNIVNNDDLPLFDTGGNIIGGSYKYSSFDDDGRRKFAGEAGIHYADLSVSGALTSANQQYFLFPYEYYNLAGNMNAWVGHVIFDFASRRKHLNHSFKIGAIDVFSGEFNARTHYRKRKFFGKEEKSEDLDPVELKSTGFAFVAYSMETPVWRIHDKINISFKLRKILGCPWGIGKFSDDDGNEDDSGTGDGWLKQIGTGNLIKTILLSGLSGNLKIEF